MLTAGTRLGSYEVVSVLGVGGMGEVYRARDTRLQRDVAVKVLPEVFASDPERLARFEREAQLLASLNHPHIAAIYGLEESSGLRALILELVEGPTLADRIAQGPVPIDDALPIAKQVADALEAAHGQGIIHRDLKPANIKLRPDGTVKVLDFGLAKLTDVGRVLPSGPAGSKEQDPAYVLSQSPTITSPAMMTGMGTILGTAAYMAPEQAKGRAADKRSDVWAFGCVLYEMLTGKRAFEGEDVAETLAFVLSRDVDWTRLPANTPVAIRRLLRRALEKNRARRLSDIADARLEVEEAMSAPADGVVPVAVATMRPLWRRALPILAAVVVTAVVVGYLVWRSRPEQPRPVTRFTVTLPQGENFTRAGGHVLALSPDGARLVYAANLRLYLRARDQLEATPIRGTEGAGAGSSRRPFFSPDGQWIGFWQDGQIKKVSVTGGAPVVLCAAAVAHLGANWGGDDTIVFGGGPTGIWRVSGTGGTPENIVKLDEGLQAHGPQMLPDGQTVLFTLGKGAAWDQAQIVVQSLDTGARRVLVNGGTDGRYVSTGHLVYILGGAILAVPFDVDTLEVTGGPVPLVEDVADAGAASAAGQFTLTGDGTLAYVPGNIAVGGTQRTLVWVDRQGREEPIPAPPNGYLYPRISPDGTRLALDVGGQNRDIWVWDFARRTLTRLTFDPTPDRAPIWTPDGRRLIFNSDRAGGGNLFWQAADGTGEAERLTDSPKNQFATGISLDGTQVIFRETTAISISNDLMVLTMAGTHKVQPLLTSMFDEGNGELATDGRWLAYQSTASGREEIYVRPFPDVGGGQWQISTMGGSEPSWARDGRELFYRAPDGALMRVPVDGGAAWKAGTPTRVLQGGYYEGNTASTNVEIANRTYDISPDGRRFVMIKEGAVPAEPAATARIIVVENWFEELKRRVPVE